MIFSTWKWFYNIKRDLYIFHRSHHFPCLFFQFWNRLCFRCQYWVQDTSCVLHGCVKFYLLHKQKKNCVNIQHTWNICYYLFSKAIYLFRNCPQVKWNATAIDRTSILINKFCFSFSLMKFFDWNWIRIISLQLNSIKELLLHSWTQWFLT